MPGFCTVLDANVLCLCFSVRVWLHRVDDGDPRSPRSRDYVSLPAELQPTKSLNPSSPGQSMQEVTLLGCSIEGNSSRTVSRRSQREYTHFMTRGAFITRQFSSDTRSKHLAYRMGVGSELCNW